MLFEVHEPSPKSLCPSSSFSRAFHRVNDVDLQSLDLSLIIFSERWLDSTGFCRLPRAWV